MLELRGAVPAQLHDGDAGSIWRGSCWVVKGRDQFRVLGESRKCTAAVVLTTNALLKEAEQKVSHCSDAKMLRRSMVSELNQL